MRLKEDRVRLICQKIIQNLRSRQLIHFKKTEIEVLKRMEQIFIEDLEVEKKIDQEAEQMVRQYASKMGGNIDKEKMFQLIKKQLIKDKNVVI